MNVIFNNWRKESGLNQEQVAELFGFSKSMVSMLENGKRKPSSDKRIQIDEITNGQVSYKDW